MDWRLRRVGALLTKSTKAVFARNPNAGFLLALGAYVVQKAVKRNNEVKWSKIVEIYCSLMKIVED